MKGGIFMAGRDPEKKQAYDRTYRKTYREAHRDKLNAVKRTYHAANRAEQNFLRSIYYYTHRDEALGRQAAYNALHREERRAYDKVYRAAHQHERKRYNETRREEERILEARRRATKRNLPATLTKAEWDAIKAAYKSQCAYCGKKPKLLTQDHVIPLSKGGGTTKENIVPACLSCNSRKRSSLPTGPIKLVLL